ncbi:MAG TPA: Ig-like domain-containing protein [Haliangiales bacterium]|nr:Ig-like domain-containing protein [Haliangiales bacterium]
MNRRLISTVKCLGLVLALGALLGSNAGTPASETELTPGDLSSFRHFGSAVAMDGDTIVVGAPLDSEAGFDAGAAYVFVRAGSSWSQQARLLAADAASSTRFGSSVALSGDTLVVGAPFAGTTDTGAAYVFVRNGSSWTQQAKLASTDAIGGDQFGTSLAVEGDTLAVGAVGAGLDFLDEGAVYVFTRSSGTWTQQARLRSDHPGPGNELGLSVALNNGTLAVGSPYDDDLSIGDAGAVYVFVRSGSAWNLQTELTASDAALGDHLGWSVALNGDTLVAGAPKSAGAAYVFVRNGATWSPQAKLLADDPGAFDNFGTSVAVINNLAVIGSAYDSSFAQQGGSAYLFTRNGSAWSQDSEFSAGDIESFFQFGYAIAASGTNVVVGAPGGGSLEDGAAYVFEISLSNTAPAANAQSLTTAEDTPVSLTLAGSDAESDPLQFTVLSGPTNGTLTGAPPNLTYTPDANVNGSDSFTFKVNDGSLDSLPATVSITVTPVNDAPVADSQSVTTPEDTAVTFTLTGSDIESSPLTFTIVNSPANGTLSGTPPDLIYTPNANANGPDSFTFKVNDGQLDSAPATVSITVTPVNHSPVADASATLPEVISPNLTDALVTLDGSRSYDPDNDPLTYTWLEGGNTVGTGAVVQVTLAVGTHTLTLAVSDGKASDSATVTVRVITLAESIFEILAAVEATDIPSTQKTGLLASLQAAANSCARGNLISGVNQLQAFENKVSAQAGKKIDDATANDLIADAQNVIQIITDAATAKRPLHH